MKSSAPLVVRKKERHCAPIYYPQGHGMGGWIKDTLKKVQKFMSKSPIALTPLGILPNKGIVKDFVEGKMPGQRYFFPGLYVGYFEEIVETKGEILIGEIAIAASIAATILSFGSTAYLIPIAIAAAVSIAASAYEIVKSLKKKREFKKLEEKEREKLREFERIERQYMSDIRALEAQIAATREKVAKKRKRVIDMRNEIKKMTLALNEPKIPPHAPNPLAVHRDYEPPIMVGSEEFFDTGTYREIKEVEEKKEMNVGILIGAAIILGASLWRLRR